MTEIDARIEHRTLTASVHRWTSEQVRAMDEPVIFDVAFQVMPDPLTEGFLPIVAIYLEVAGPHGKGYVYGCPVLNPGALKENFVKALVRDALGSLIATREAKERESPVSASN